MFQQMRILNVIPPFLCDLQKIFIYSNLRPVHFRKLSLFLQSINYTVNPLPVISLTLSNGCSLYWPISLSPPPTPDILTVYHVALLLSSLSNRYSLLSHATHHRVTCFNHSSTSQSSSSVVPLIKFHTHFSLIHFICTSYFYYFFSLPCTFLPRYIGA